MMNNVAELISPRFSSPAEPLPAFERPHSIVAVASGEAGAPELQHLLSHIVSEESALYAITREWRYDAAARQFFRLHALLDEQFSEIGIRLTRLAARSRALDGRAFTTHGDHATVPRKTVTDGARQAHMVRELLGLHEAISGSLREGSAASVARFHDPLIADLLADLAGDHEKDAFMLRALLWEAKSNPT